MLQFFLSDCNLLLYMHRLIDRNYKKKKHMKKLTQILVLLFLGFALNGAAQNASVTNAITSDGDTVVTSQIVGADADTDSLEESVTFTYQTGDFDNLDEIVENSIENVTSALVGPFIIGGLFIIAITVLIIFIIWIRYKQNKERMRIISESIAAGKPVNLDYMGGKEYLHAKQSANQIYRNMVWEKGIRNICTGVAMMVFLYILTETAGIAAIGFIIFCTGVSQVIISRGSRDAGDTGNSVSYQASDDKKEDAPQENSNPDTNQK